MNGFSLHIKPPSYIANQLDGVFLVYKLDTSETFQVLLACPHHLHVNLMYIDLNFNVVTFQLLNRQ